MSVGGLNLAQQPLDNHNVYLCDISDPPHSVLFAQCKADVTFIACCLNVHLNIIKQEVTYIVSPVMGIESG